MGLVNGQHAMSFPEFFAIDPEVAGFGNPVELRLSDGKNVLRHGIRGLQSGFLQTTRCEGMQEFGEALRLNRFRTVDQSPKRREFKLIPLVFPGPSCKKL